MALFFCESIDNNWNDTNLSSHEIIITGHSEIFCKGNIPWRLVKQFIWIWRKRGATDNNDSDKYEDKESIYEFLTLAYATYDPGYEEYEGIDIDDEYMVPDIHSMED